MSSPEDIEVTPGAGTTRRSLPGDPLPEREVDAMLRVDHAGEYGARRIYEGQLAVLGRSAAGAILRKMHAQELKHLQAFDKLMVERQVRPTLLGPVWHVAGFALGAATALLGERAAMACTVAVEEVIDRHYQGQVERLGESEPKLRETFEAFRREEVEHRDTALSQGAQEAPAYGLLTGAIKTGSRLAIWLSTKI
jgi:ubiquinone biosynthesis monooxygenase Coq7